MVRQGIEPGILASAIQADIHGPSTQYNFLGRWIATNENTEYDNPNNHKII